jgi:N-acetylmuramoyl-L-alanine amidase
MMKTGKDLLSLGRTRLWENYFFGARVPKDASSWHGPWDCAEFISWLVYQTAKILYGCDKDFGDPAWADAGTVYWDRDARRLGNIISLDLAAAIPGAAVLRVATASLCGHIVLSDGKGGTVEAACARLGVIEGTLHDRRWDMGILVPGIDYDQGAQPIPVALPNARIYRLTHPLMIAPGIKLIQQALKIKADGIYGPQTEMAVAGFQAGHGGLVADGEAGPLTLAALGIKTRGGGISD